MKLYDLSLSGNCHKVRLFAGLDCPHESLARLCVHARIRVNGRDVAPTDLMWIKSF
ncbi:MAG: hypothetical protein RLZZ271_1065 [Pseudomonadota bacterium]|jgi:hypothetical protein